MEALAASALLRQYTPDLKVRFVNVIDLMSLTPTDVHPHGLSNERFEALFGSDLEVVMAFHGYARAVHQLVHGRRHPGRFHVRGFQEQGTTTTPFDMVVLNEMSRYHLAVEVLRRSAGRPEGFEELEEHCDSMLARHHEYVREHLEDMPEISDWTWPG
jgi:xylulose-5-phosphate/fructose-6-phosphate phosphoketolase